MDNTLLISKAKNNIFAAINILQETSNLVLDNEILDWEQAEVFKIHLIDSKMDLREAADLLTGELEKGDDGRSA